ncbi:GNAT family N-acetyltransferase [Nonomuraea sp. NPDC050783]|uniref:GNAT family N-acetyltransferase n=1 Tax=Nonomuraea sp. NPDC050783 TaxID=3154634 RepID=UPI0034666CE1
MTYPIRPIDESEWPAFSGVLDESFGWTPHPQQNERFKAETEFDRTLAVFDGDTIVGVTAVFSLKMAVPGGRVLPVGGVTAVSVLPSHRRRGVLSQMMRRQLSDIRDRGEAVAALYASESVIYGRFGYGRAASELSFRIAKRASAFVANAPVDPSLRARVARPADVRGELESLFASLVSTRPGRYERHAAFWDVNLADEEFDQRGMGSLRCVLAEDDRGVRGYALFRVKTSWDDNGVPEGELRLYELEAADPAAYALLWRNLLDRDLLSTVRAPSRPVDDPLQALLADPRQLRATWGDELWVRLVEVDRALTGRAYAAPVDLVIEVEDDVCPWNAARWRLTADPAGAECKQVEDEPDLTVPVSALGSAYLGDGQLGPQLAAGLLREHRPGAVRALATAMSWSPRPWAGRVF